MKQFQPITGDSSFLWYDNFIAYKNHGMKKYIILGMIGLAVVSPACVQKQKGHPADMEDTFKKSSIDTSGQEPIPGTPGSGGTDGKRDDSSTLKQDSIRK